MKRTCLRLGASKLVVASTLLLSANGAWALSTSCAASPYNSLATVGTTGCYEVDKTFTNFASSTDFLTPTLGLGGTFIDGSSSGYSPTNPYTVSETFYGSAAGGAWTATGGTTSGDFTETVNSANNPVNPGYPSGSNPNFITSVSLTTSGSAGDGTNDRLIVYQRFCLSGSPTNCGATNFVTIEAIYNSGDSTPNYSCKVTGAIAGVSCASPTSDMANILFSDQVTTLLVQNAYTLQEPGGATTVTLNFFEDTFGEQVGVPEPSTLVLFGSALAAIAALRLRQRKQS
jgi:PEP-CTERM motif-containing protein